MVRGPRRFSPRARAAVLLTLSLAFLGLTARLPAQDHPSEAAAPQIAAETCPAPASPRQISPGQTALEAAASAAAASRAAQNKSSASTPEQAQTDSSQPAQSKCQISPALPQFSSSRIDRGEFVAPGFSAASFRFSASGSSALAPDLARQPQSSSLLPSSKYPVTSRTGKWGGEEWEPAFLQTLGFTLAQNGYRLATEQKTRHALTLETWHRYYLAISGLHTWSDGGKTWTVYIAHPAQGAVFNDIWIEHDPHAALLYFGFNKVYWGEHIKSFWWDSVWELQWKFGPFSEASIGNVGLVPGKLGANTIVSSALIGTGLSVGEDMLDRYAIRHWEKHTDNRVARALLRSSLNPDRSFANLFRKKYPWYRDMRPTLRDLDTN